MTGKYDLCSTVQETDGSPANVACLPINVPNGTVTDNTSSITLNYAGVPSGGVFTTGSIPFGDGTASLAQNNANLFWDNTNRRLGIGTTGPTDLLHVYSASGQAQIRVEAATNVRASLRLVSSNATWGFLTSNNASGDLTLTQGGADTTRVTFLSGGNVGIGTTSPGNTLDVAGTIDVSTNNIAALRQKRAGGVMASLLTLDNGDNLLLGPNTGTIVMQNANGQVWTFTGAILRGNSGANTILESRNIQGGTATTSDLTLQSTSGVGAAGADIIFKVGNNGATEAMRILNSGNVGIGTANPSQRLHVVGTTSNTVAILQAGLAGWQDWLAFQDTAGTSQGLIGVETGGAGGLMPGTLLNSLGIRGQNIFFTGDGGSTTNMTIRSTGNVGIGTASPGTRLHVQGPTAGDSGRFTDNSNSTFYIGHPVASVVRLGVGGSTQDLRFGDHDGGTDAMTVKGTGNVGIGTTSPSTLLHLDSAARGIIVQTDVGAQAGNEPFIQLDKSRGSVGSPAVVVSGDILGDVWGRGYDGANFQIAGGVRVSADGAVSAGIVPGRVLLYTANTSGTLTERMRIDNAGNVGIGTTSPSALLHALATTEQLRLGYNSTNYTTFTVDSAGALTLRAGAGTRGIVVDSANTAVTPTSTQALTLGSSGTRWATYFGTGLDLTAAATISVNNTAINLTGTTPRIVFPASSVGGIYDSNAARYITIDSTGATKLMGMMLDGGNIGIGTTSPQATLDVQGSLRTIATSTSANLSLTTAHQTVLATTGAGGITLTLPAASANTIGLRYDCIKVDAGAGALTIATAGADTINGAASKTVSTQYAAARVVGISATAWAAQSLGAL